MSPTEEKTERFFIGLFFCRVEPFSFGVCVLIAFFSRALSCMFLRANASFFTTSKYGAPFRNGCYDRRPKIMHTRQIDDSHKSSATRAPRHRYTLVMSYPTLRLQQILRNF